MKEFELKNASIFQLNSDSLNKFQNEWIEMGKEAFLEKYIDFKPNKQLFDWPIINSSIHLQYFLFHK